MIRAAFPPVANDGMETRVPFHAALDGLPAKSVDRDDLPGGIDSIASTNHQHPDHDTRIWPAEDKVMSAWKPIPAAASAARCGSGLTGHARHLVSVLLPDVPEGLGKPRRWRWFPSAMRALEWTRGQPSWFQSSNAARRGFCENCGTPLAYDAPDGLALVGAGV
jgi:hypothetical protein